MRKKGNAGVSGKRSCHCFDSNVRQEKHSSVDEKLSSWFSVPNDGGGPKLRKTQQFNANDGVLSTWFDQWIILQDKRSQRTRIKQKDRKRVTWSNNEHI